MSQLHREHHWLNNAIALSQQLGIPLVKDCEELLAKIQENLGDNG